MRRSVLSLFLLVILTGPLFVPSVFAWEPAYELRGSIAQGLCKPGETLVSTL